MMIRFLALVVIFWGFNIERSFAVDDCVVLLHGLARTANSMKRIESFLDQAGFRVVNVNYPSRSDAIPDLAESAVKSGIEQCQEEELARINFVTHSLGGILVRYYLKNNRLENLGRVVMLGPPNQGSELVDQLGSIPGFELLNGPSSVQLTTGSQWLLDELGPVEFELGVIAGNRSINPFYSSLIPGDDDGKVSISSTRVDGMAQHIELPVTHTWMMFNRTVLEQIVEFLTYGSFKQGQVQLGSSIN